MAVEVSDSGVSHADIPLYRLVDEETATVWFSAARVEGFFADPDDSEAAGAPVVFTGVTGGVVGTGQVREDAELRVVDGAGRVIGSYYVGRVEAVEAGAGRCVVSFGGLTEPYPAAGEVWRRWASGAPVRSGEWMEYPATAHASWLHVTQQVWFVGRGLEAARYEEGARCMLDGRRIVGEDSFFCELGEAMNGIGGYFGSSFGGFEDCLRYAYGPTRIREVVWNDAASSTPYLDAEFVRLVGEVLADHDVALRFA